MPRKGIMLCYPFEEKRLNKWNTSSVIIQPKLDGERCRAIFDNFGKVTLLSSEENIITSVPHINLDLEAQQLANIELDGELYIHGRQFEEIHSIVGRTKNEHYASNSMQYHIFDCFANTPQIARLRFLKLRILQTESIRLVPYSMEFGIENIMRGYEVFINNGYEGFIVRNPHADYERKRSTNIMKFKPKKTDIYKITGYAEEISIQGNRKNALGAFICKGDDGTEFQVGSGFTREQRETIWKYREDYIGKYCEVQYQRMTTKNKVPRFPVFIETREDIL